MTLKKVVRYSDACRVTIGGKALVECIDHPDSLRVSNKGISWTSTVVAIFPNGDFETLNTIYRKIANE